MIRDIQSEIKRRGRQIACDQCEVGAAQVQAPEAVDAGVRKKDERILEIQRKRCAAGNVVAICASGEQHGVVVPGIIHPLNGVVGLRGAAGGVINLLVDHVQRQVGGCVG